MGGFLAKFRNVLESFGEQEARILMLGLEAAGKATILYKLKLNETPTRAIPPAFETISLKNVTLRAWDLGGPDKIRPAWKHFFKNTDGLFFVIDSADKERFNQAKEELFWILDSDEMVGVPVVVLANKQDLPNAVAPPEIATKLAMSHIRNRQWHVHGTCATNGDGLLEAMTELVTMAKQFQKDRR